VTSLFDKRLLLVTGKGGVGRTTLAAALAIAAAQKGRRVILSEIAEADGDYTALARVFSRNTLPREPEEIAPGLMGTVLSAPVGHERFIETLLPRMMAKAAMSSVALRRLLESAPSFREMGVFYHFLSLLKAEDDGEPRYDLIVVDMPASGHSLGLTGLPERLLALLPTGAIATAMREGQAFVHDPEKSGAVIVTLPEVLPVTETLELAQGFADTRVPVAAILCNRVLRDPFSAEERQVLERFQHEPIYGMNRFNSIPQVSESLERLRAGVKAPVLEVEEIPLTGRALVDAAATVLAEIA